MGELLPRVGKVRRVGRLAGDGTASEADAPRAGVEVVIDPLDASDDGESSFQIGGDNPRLGMWEDYLKSQESAATPVYLRVNDESEVHEVLPTFRYTVESAEVTDDGTGVEARVFFRQSPALHLLNGTHRRFAELLSLLADAAQAKRDVL